jgi:uncharacterized integral membrane protein
VPSRGRRPYDDVAYWIAVIVGIPMLAGSVLFVVAATNSATRDFGVLGGVATFIAGIAVLLVVTFKAYAWLRESGGR